MKKIFIASALLLFAAWLAAQTSQTPEASKARGKKLYAQYCLTCHQESGEGVPKLNPSLINTSYVSGDKTKLILWVLSGSPDPKIAIDGKFYSNNMPAQKNLSDQQIADVLTYIRNSFGNKASAVLPADVKKVRSEMK